jgi:hypothetical protein
MRPFSTFLLVAAAALAVAASSASAETTETVKFDPSRMWECTEADGSSMYTNKERAGCKLMVLKELSVVPSLEHMPTYRPAPSAAPSRGMSGYVEGSQWSAGVGGQHIPDWAKNWYASVASSGPIHEEVCSLYGEWLALNQKTRGGFFFGTDPSYGGDLSGQNRRGPSFSFYDNARYLTLAKLFGPGFVPIGCQ